MRGIDLTSLFGLHFCLANDFALYQLLTYMFLHSGFMHLFFNMFALWMFGRVIESVLGSRRFLVYYFVSGIGAGVMQEIAQFVSFYLMMNSQAPGISFGELLVVADTLSYQLNMWTTIGASGAVYAILLAFGMIFPNERIFIFPLPIPIKAKWFVLFYVAVELWAAMNSSGDGVAHTAHLGGMLFGFLLLRYWKKHPDSYYSMDSGTQFFDKLKRNFEERMKQKPEPEEQDEELTREETDYEYNARKKARQDEIDRILDKIRKSGYDSLTKEEKKTLFDESND